jgi:hypothetical protein
MGAQQKPVKPARTWPIAYQSEQSHGMPLG